MRLTIWRRKNCQQSRACKRSRKNISSQDLTGVSHETTVGDTQRISSRFCQIGNQLDVADRQSKLELVFKPCFLQHVCHMEFDR